MRISADFEVIKIRQPFLRWQHAFSSDELFEVVVVEGRYSLILEEVEKVLRKVDVHANLRLIDQANIYLARTIEPQRNHRTYDHATFN